MTSKESFDTAFSKAIHFIELYDLLHDTRQRSIRNDWSKKFKPLMSWKQKEEIVRIDGKNRKSVLIFQKSVGIDREKFAHEYSSELLRSSVVTAVSAMDRYFHDVVVEFSIDILKRKENEIPKEMKKIELPILIFKNTIQRTRKNTKSRPGTIIKSALQDKLHREYTFQKPEDILIAMKMLGIKDFWRIVAAEIGTGIDKDELLKRLRIITLRRNQIVHEADLVRKIKIKKLTLRDISRTDTHKWIIWIKDFIEATNKVIINNK